MRKDAYKERLPLLFAVLFSALLLSNCGYRPEGIEAAQPLSDVPAAAALPEGALVRRAGSVWLAAVPCAEDAPFPLTELFCLARIETVAGRRCVVFAFDASGWPVLRGDSAKQ